MWNGGGSDEEALLAGCYRTALDPHVVRDESTFAEPHRYPIGIPYVVVNGAVVVDGGRMNPLGTGRVLTP